MSSDECYACVVGVATGPESHSEDCPARNIPMPVQDGQWGHEWNVYDRQVAAARAAVEETRRERGIDRHHDSGADSGSLSEYEEDERRARGR